MSPLVGSKTTSIVSLQSQLTDSDDAEGIIALKDIEKKYHLTMAFLTLASSSPRLFETMGTSPSSRWQHRGPTHNARGHAGPTPYDAYSQLVQGGYFDKAITLAVNYDMSLELVFEILTKRCVLLQQHIDYASQYVALLILLGLQEAETLS